MHVMAATPVPIDTLIRLASMRQINRAIDHAIQGEYECAITLAGAAEGMLPETWKPHFRQKIQKFAELPEIKEEGGATEPNDYKNWLKHGTLNGERIEATTIPAEESVVMVYRAITKYHAVYDDLSPQMLRFLNWMCEWLQKEVGSRYHFAKPRKPAPKPDDPEQSKRFIETAEEVGADTDDQALERAFAKIVPANRPAVSPAGKESRALRSKPLGRK